MNPDYAKFCAGATSFLLHNCEFMLLLFGNILSDSIDSLSRLDLKSTFDEDIPVDLQGCIADGEELGSRLSS